MNIFIIIPAFNEAKTIYKVIKEIQDATMIHGAKFMILVVDDGSTDQTIFEAERARAQVIRHIVNRGQGAALQTGTEYAIKQGADIIVHFDADGQHEVSDILKLIRPIINKETDVVLGSRFLNEKLKIKNEKLRNYFIKLIVTSYQLLVTKEIPFLRRLLLLGSLVTNYLITGLLLSDVHNGLRALNLTAAQKIEISQDRMAHNTEYLQEINRLDLAYCEEPVTVRYDLAHKKSQGFFEGLRILQELIFGKIAK